MWLYILVFVLTFFGMEFMAWFTHKYVMHGFLWSLHKDHHKKDHESWFERNDAFFIFYAVVSMIFFLLWQSGLTYFLVHDIFIHQRFKLFRNANHKYARALRRAHKMHHKHIGKQDGECFGMLVIPWKYYKNA
jgi:beta-carotene 3-hydroxylase